MELRKKTLYIIFWRWRYIYGSLAANESPKSQAHSTGLCRGTSRGGNAGKEVDRMLCNQSPEPARVDEDDGIMPRKVVEPARVSRANSTEGNGYVRQDNTKKDYDSGAMGVTGLGLSALREGKFYRTEDKVLKREQFWHRTAEILRASGWSPKQIAEHLGHHVNQLYELDKDPRFQANVNKLIEERVGANDVLALAKARAIDAHNVIVRIMNDKNAPAAVQLKAACTIEERVFGKALQRVESDSTIRSADPVAEVERLQKEAADYRMRLGDQAG